MDVALRRTSVDDLDFVIELERDTENARFIGQWSRDEHRDALDRTDREHWIVVTGSGERLGYIILYDLRGAGHGVYVKRIVVDRKSTGVGRRALGLVLARAFRQLGAELVSLAVYPENARAQRAYRAVGFVVAALSPTERRAMQREVDPFPDPCLVMVARAPAP